MKTLLITTKQASNGYGHFKKIILLHYFAKFRPGQISFWKHPPSNDEDQHEELFNDDHQSISINGYGNVVQIQRDLE